MEKIELLEKMVEVQEMHIELMQDFANLQEVKNRRVADLKIQIGHQEEKIEALESENAELKKQIAELKKQYEKLQQSIISVEQNQ